jgi:hypothetical protein
LQRIHFAADGYAQPIRLPQYRMADVTVDPDHAQGRGRRHEDQDAQAPDVQTRHIRSAPQHLRHPSPNVITEFAAEPLNLPRGGHAQLPGGGQRDYFV